MTTKTIIEGLTLENLVDLFSTATYGSSWLDIDAPDRTGLAIEDGDCREDVWAKALLAGKHINCIDYYAEGDSYGFHPCVIDEDENGVYTIGLDDILEGLSACADGTFKGEKSDHDWLKDCFNHFRAGEGDMDLPEAEALMQVIMFNELIYG